MKAIWKHKSDPRSLVAKLESAREICKELTAQFERINDETDILLRVLSEQRKTIKTGLYGGGNEDYSSCEPTHNKEEPKNWRAASGFDDKDL